MKIYYFMPTYSDQLKKPSWQRRRLEILQIDNFRCTQCGNTERELQVHHKDYFPGKEPWEYPDSDLITLCNVCHIKESKREKHENYLIYSLRNSGFTAFEVLALSVYIDQYEGFRNDIRNLLTRMQNLDL